LLMKKKKKEKKNWRSVFVCVYVCSKYNSSNTYTRFGSIYAPPYLAKPDKRGTTGRLAFHTRSLVVDTRRTHGQ
jgi:hypothetical protein